MQISPHLASPQWLPRREAALPAATCPRDLRYNTRMQKVGETSHLGKAGQPQGFMGHRLCSTYHGEQCGNHKERRHKLGPDHFFPGPTRPQCSAD